MLYLSYPAPLHLALASPPLYAKTHLRSAQKPKAAMNRIRSGPSIGDLSPEFTWEDVVEGRTITANGNGTTE